MSPQKQLLDLEYFSSTPLIPFIISILCKSDLFTCIHIYVFCTRVYNILYILFCLTCLTLHLLLIMYICVNIWMCLCVYTKFGAIFWSANPVKPFCIYQHGKWQLIYDITLIIQHLFSMLEWIGCFDSSWQTRRTVPSLPLCFDRVSVSGCPS